MTLVHNRCKFADKQLVKLQETPGRQANAPSVFLSIFITFPHSLLSIYQFYYI